jgi:3,4-dihydroxy 2-butanone 4-phosphate synthase / GTP cyclohydrolase II
MLEATKSADTLAATRLDRAINDVRAGKPVIICDAPDREGEGDFALAARACTPEMINLLIRRGSGLLCLALRPQDADRIGICALAHNNTDRFATRFAMPISLNDGGTGVSFHARAATIRSAADRTSGADRFSPSEPFAQDGVSAGGSLVRQVDKLV